MNKIVRIGQPENVSREIIDRCVRALKAHSIVEAELADLRNGHSARLTAIIMLIDAAREMSMELDTKEMRKAGAFLCNAAYRLDVEVY